MIPEASAQKDPAMESRPPTDKTRQAGIRALLHEGHHRVIWSRQSDLDGQWIDFDSSFAAELEASQKDGTFKVSVMRCDHTSLIYDTIQFTVENENNGEKAFIRRTLQDAAVWEYQDNTFFWPLGKHST